MLNQMVGECRLKEEEKRVVNERPNGHDSVENALLKFFIKERLPLSKLDSIHLRELIEGMSYIVRCHE